MRMYGSDSAAQSNTTQLEAEAVKLEGSFCPLALSLGLLARPPLLPVVRGASLLKQVAGNARIKRSALSHASVRDNLSNIAAAKKSPLARYCRCQKLPVAPPRQLSRFAHFFTCVVILI